MMQIAEPTLPTAPPPLTTLAPMPLASTPGGLACPTGATEGGVATAGSSTRRDARLIARRGFVELKQVFMRVLVDVPGGRADRLRAQVRLAEEPQALWALRALILGALNGVDDDSRRRRQMLRRGLDSVFDDDTVPDACGPAAAAAAVTVDAGTLSAVSS